MRPNRYAELKPEVAFIQRDRRDAVARAQAQIQETGRYEGWLPLGTYIMGDQTFTVEQPYHVVEPLPV